MSRKFSWQLGAVVAGGALLCIVSQAGIVESSGPPVPSPPETVGPNPKIPPVDKHLIPTVQIAPVKGWPRGDTPRAANGVAVNAFATGLHHPRWLYVLPNGDVLVAETDAPPKPDDAKGLKGKAYKTVQKKAGADTPPANRILLLRDTNGDGVAEMKTVFIDHLDSPFGIALVGSDLYVADTDAILRFTYQPGETTIAGDGQKVTDLPAGAINHHWTYSYWGQHVDDRVKPQRPDLVAKAVAPDYALGAHVAALGLVAATKTSLPAPFANGMFIGEHGSWNRKPIVGYKVVFVPFADGKPSGSPLDVLTGFVSDKGEAYGRPVGVAIDAKGDLLVTDDVGNTVWRATGARPTTAPAN
jgi:glucose/arabinose dehydrogenase